MAITLDGTTGITAPGVTDTGNLSVTGTSTLTGAVSQTSSSTAASFIPTGSTVPANGMYLSAANTLNLATNTTNQVSISSSGIVTGTAGNLMLVSRTAQASTSGTSIDFTSIPSWVKRITVMFNGVSLSNTESLTVQLGTGGVPTTSGYTGSSTRLQATAVSTNAYSGSGFECVALGVAANLATGNLVITNITGNTWTCTGILAGTVTNLQDTTAGVIAMAGVVDLVRITSTGAATFDAGSINILYE